MSAANFTFQSDYFRRQLADAKSEGEAHGKAEALLAIFAARGIDVPEDVRAEIVECDDPDRLDRWIQRAATAAQTDDLRGLLRVG